MVLNREEAKKQAVTAGVSSALLLKVMNIIARYETKDHSKNVQRLMGELFITIIPTRTPNN